MKEDTIIHLLQRRPLLHDQCAAVVFSIGMHADFH